MVEKSERWDTIEIKTWPRVGFYSYFQVVLKNKNDTSIDPTPRLEVRTTIAEAIWGMIPRKEVTIEVASL